MARIEQRALRMHPRLLWDVIHRQAGTISKAILEGVMNTVDAGATRCDISFDRKSFLIEDDGRGFQNQEEIVRFFETFGYPHKEGDAHYGRFRMGRGQMFAFGVNRWSTNTFRMKVDLKPQKDEMGDEVALGYELGTVDDVHPGCRIEVSLYEHLTPSGFDAAVRELQEAVKYVPIPVRINGKVSSRSPTTEQWDVEVPEGYIRFKDSGTFDIYNLGVLVNKSSSWRHGVSGIFVSAKPLDVNFARNDVQSTCKVFRKVLSILETRTLDATKKPERLTDAQRDSLGHRLASGELSVADVENARIITDVTGSHHKFQILQNLRAYGNRMAIASRGDRAAEVVHTRKLGFIVTTETANRFGAETSDELVAVLNRLGASHWGRSSWKPIAGVGMETFADLVSNDYVPLSDRELNTAERFALRALRHGYKLMVRTGCMDDHSTDRCWFSVSGSRSGGSYAALMSEIDSRTRRISAGSSDVAQAWTNGTDEIWVNRKSLGLMRDGMDGMLRLAGLLLHEQLHESPSTRTHEHGVEFYERFHDLAIHTDILGMTATHMLTFCLKELRDDDKNISRSFGRDEDLLVTAAERGIGPALDEDGPPAPSM